MNNVDTQYLALAKDVIENGKPLPNRTGTDTLRVFSRSMRFNLQEGFPLLTTKKLNPNNIIGEVLWFLAGKNDLASLRKLQCKEEGSHTIWSDDFEKYWDRVEARSRGYTTHRLREAGGRIYGKQLRCYGYREGYEVDQLSLLVENIKAVKENPSHTMARRLKCEFWNPEDHLDSDGLKAALPACHTGFQCLVDDGKLNLKFFMRSNDVFLGLPYNIASYATICHILAELTGLEVGELVYDGTDVHVYVNHIEQLKTQMAREPYLLPKIVIPKLTNLEDLDNLTAEDFKIVDYKCHPFIKGEQAS